MWTVSTSINTILKARRQLKKPVGVLNPQRLSGPGCRRAGLQQAASFYQNGVTWNQLLNAQFPGALTDAHGSFTKPASW